MSTLPLTAGELSTHDASTVTVASVTLNKFKTSSLELQKKYRSTPEYREKENKRRKSSPSRQPYYRILETSRRKDKKAGLENNLTREIVQNLVSQPCCYCESAEKMSIDRKDSSVGHIVENCVPCCLRCNYIKRDVPYEAWLIIAPAIKEAVKLGLFGNWTRQIRR